MVVVLAATSDLRSCTLLLVITVFILRGAKSDCFAWQWLDVWCNLLFHFSFIIHRVILQGNMMNESSNHQPYVLSYQLWKCKSIVEKIPLSWIFWQWSFETGFTIVLGYDLLPAEAVLRNATRTSCLLHISHTTLPSHPYCSTLFTHTKRSHSLICLFTINNAKLSHFIHSKYLRTYCVSSKKNAY